jgi:histidinol-phosphate/aromatic aminotransferase/cobyric acid decarboxylase-like protein
MIEYLVIFHRRGLRAFHIKCIERLGRPTEEIIKLDANENPYGPPPGDMPQIHVSLGVLVMLH